MSVADPMRVLHVTHTAQPGGAELALARLLGQPHPWQAALYAPPTGVAFDQLPAQEVAQARDLPTLPTGGTRSGAPLLAARYLTALRDGARVLRRSPLFQQADLVHANTAAAAIICALADRAGRRPLVVHLRGPLTVESLGPIGLPAFRRLAMRRADGIIANSGFTLASVPPGPRVPAQRTVIQSPSGISERLAHPEVRPQVRAIGMVGRLQHWKGQHVFLRAFAASLRGTDVRAYLCGAPLFGEEAYETQLRDLAATLGISEQVTFRGHVDDINGFLDSIDILVHSSLGAEPLGQTVLQGLARALPVVATEGGGPGEWIRSGVNGMLVPPGDPDALASVLRTLVASQRLRHDLATAAAHTPGLLSDADCVDRHAEFFETVRRAHRPARARDAA
ncbi:glycosyltransferase family 4 protein [Micromonospora sp. NPDC005215]|uniref:glycosyltransferase family 4 protein n=1 Tax=Micromonospora sp. NPDC005215 TaxID=3157024 RepID=UPI0033B0BF9A